MPLPKRQDLLDSNKHTGKFAHPFIIVFMATFLAIGLAACDSEQSLTAERYARPDLLFEQIKQNVEASENLEIIQEIDHSRLGAEAGSNMPPARVLIFSNPELETVLIQKNPLSALDLPLRILAYEALPGGESRVIFNNFDYLSSRYQLTGLNTIGAQYQKSLDEALESVDQEHIASFANDQMQPDGIITLASPFDFTETLKRVRAGIGSQDDTVGFGEIDFKARALELGLIQSPITMILFGGPAPGAKAMSKAPTLGLDGFCQKFLVWEDRNGQVNLSFNDLMALAERQDASKSPALRVINYRLKSIFTEALELD